MLREMGKKLWRRINAEKQKTAERPGAKVIEDGFAGNIQKDEICFW